MRRSFFFLVITAAIGGTAHADDTITFIPLQTENVQLTQFSGNGAYAVGSIAYTAGFRWTASTGAEELIDSMDSAQGINNAGTIAGSLAVDGGSYNGGDSLGAYAPVGSDPIQLTSPLQDDSMGFGISDDGTVVGLSFGYAYTGASQAFIWKDSTGMQALTVNRPANASRANVISADGSVIAGWNDADNGSRNAVIWQGGVPWDVVGSNGNPVGEADGISPNGRFVVGSSYVTTDGSGGWRWDQLTGQLTLLPNMDFVFGVSNDGKTAVGSAGFFSVTYPQRSALIWQDGVGTMLLVDYLAAQGVAIPADWDPNLAGGFAAISGDGSMLGGWTSGPSARLSYVIKIDRDEIFADGFDGSPPSVSAAFSPTTVIAQGAPATLTITLTNNAQATAVLNSDFVDSFPFGLVVASTPNASTTCGSSGVAAYSGYGSVTLHAGATIAPQASCKITVSVTADTSGDFTNVIPAGALVTSMGTNTAAASASLHVLPPGSSNGIVHSGVLNHLLNDQGDGTSINLITGQIDDTGPYTGPWDFNIYNDGFVLVIYPISTYNAQIAMDDSFAVQMMQPGDVIGPSNTFGTFVSTPADLANGTDGYVGIAFQCDGRQTYPVVTGTCYGYLHLQTSGANGTGYPATLLDYSYDGDGNPITISSTP